MLIYWPLPLGTQEGAAEAGQPSLRNPGGEWLLSCWWPSDSLSTLGARALEDCGFQILGTLAHFRHFSDVSSNICDNNYLQSGRDGDGSGGISSGPGDDEL